MGGTALPQGDSRASMMTGRGGKFNDPLMRMYGMMGLFNNPALTGTQKNIVGALGGYDTNTNIPEIPTYSFEKEYDPADYNVGAMPSIEEWQSQAPEYEGYKSVKGYQVPGGPSASAVALTDVTSQRDGMKIGDPTIQEVGGQVKNKKKTAGAAASSKGYYDDYAAGTGLNT